MNLRTKTRTPAAATYQDPDGGPDLEVRAEREVTASGHLCIRFETHVVTVPPEAWEDDTFDVDTLVATEQDAAARRMVARRRSAAALDRLEIPAATDIDPRPPIGGRPASPGSAGEPFENPSIPGDDE